nr:sugar transferase [Eggerthella lenta]
MSATLLDKRGYVKSSARVGDAEPMAASDVAFLAPELVSEAEGPVPVPAPAEGRLGYRFVKRVFDIAFSACAIAVLLVPSIVLCIAIRLESPGCPIYSQKRVGRIGRSGEVRTFDMYKFRSMHKDADERLAELQELNEADGPLFKIKDDPRVTRIGKFIRKHSIDELPQFLNCLAGQIPLRIIKTGQGEPCEISGLFALPAKELRTQKALFPQVKVASGTCLRTVQNFFSNHTAQRAQTQRILTKRKFTHISWGGASVALPSASRGCLAMAPHLGW